MEETLTLLLSALQDHLQGRRTVTILPDHFEELRELAKKHQLQGILQAQCGTLLQNGETFANYDRLLYTYLSNTAGIRLIEKSFAEAGIDYFIVKGPVVGQYYPQPELRTMGDVDIIVHPEDKPAAGKVLCGMGYRENADGQIEWKYTAKGKPTVELHHALVYEVRGQHSDAQLAFFENCWEHCYAHRLDWNYHFVYVMWHLCRHFRYEGVGFRQFYDLAVLVHRAPELFDWKVIEDMLRQCELLSFAKTVLTLNETWFGAESPLGKVELTEEFYEQATENIAQNGVFGFEVKKTASTDLEQKVMLSGQSLWLRKLIMFFQVLFPSYRKLQTSTKVTFIKGRPYLLPVAWVVRWIKGAFEKKSRGRTQLKQVIHTDNAYINERRSYMEQWGIEQYQ